MPWVRRGNSRLLGLGLRPCTLWGVRLGAKKTRVCRRLAGCLVEPAAGKPTIQPKPGAGAQGSPSQNFKWRVQKHSGKTKFKKQRFSNYVSWSGKSKKTNMFKLFWLRPSFSQSLKIFVISCLCYFVLFCVFPIGFMLLVWTLHLEYWIWFRWAFCEQCVFIVVFKRLLILVFYVGCYFVCCFWKRYSSNILRFPMDLYMFFENVCFTHRS